MNQKIFLKKGIECRFFLFILGLIFLGIVFQVPSAYAGPVIRIVTKPDHWLVSINGDSGPFVAAVASIKESVNPPSPFNSPLTMDDLLPTDAIWITHPTNPSASTMQFRGLIYLGNELWQGTGVDYGVLTLGANDCVTQLRLIVNGQPSPFIPPAPVSDTCPGGTGPFFTQTIPGRGYFDKGYNMIVIDIGNTGLNGSLNAVLELHLN